MFTYVCISVFEEKGEEGHRGVIAYIEDLRMGLEARRGLALPRVVRGEPLPAHTQMAAFCACVVPGPGSCGKNSQEAFK